MYIRSQVLILFFAMLSMVTFVHAQEFSSINYKVMEPVLFSGGFGTSSSFQLNGLIGQLSIGTSSTATFGISSGFLYFPFASSPVVSASAGNGQVSLSWTSSSGFNGWTASGYSVGQATASGGPYTYTSVGNVNSSTRTGLTNGTAYHFVIRIQDAFGNFIATSSEASGTPTAPAAPPASGGGAGGGGGGGVGAPAADNQTGVIFSGRAYPGTTVTVLKDGQIAAQTLSDPGANFSVRLSGLSEGSFVFAVYSEDSKGRKSPHITFPVILGTGATVTVGNIFIAPSIAVDKIEVKKGENILIFGQTTPTSEVVIQVNSESEFFVKTNTDLGGAYFYAFDTSPLEIGNHSTKSKTILQGLISPTSQTAAFKVGTKTVLAESKKCPTKGDLNNDCRVNLIDFSIAAFWYKKTLSPIFRVTESTNLTGDGKIDLVDFSIMAFNWTG